jgi:hypothetical protein
VLMHLYMIYFCLGWRSEHWQKRLRFAATNKYGTCMDVKLGKRKITYKYCKFLSWPSCGTKVPDNAAFPRSLKNAHKVQYEILLRCICIVRKKVHLHSDNTVVVVAGNMKPSARIDQSWIPTLQHIIGII